MSNPHHTQPYLQAWTRHGQTVTIRVDPDGTVRLHAQLLYDLLSKAGYDPWATVTRFCGPPTEIGYDISPEAEAGRP